MRRPRVLLLPRRRPVGDGRRRAGRARQARSSAELGLADPAKVERGFVTRVPMAYPMYDADYAERVAPIRDWLETIGNLQQVGRNGLHRYNNSDHSMLTAIRAVENIVNGTRPRHLGGQRRVRLPRGARRGRAPLQARARDQGDARAAGGRALRTTASGQKVPIFSGLWSVRRRLDACSMAARDGRGGTLAIVWRALRISGPPKRPAHGGGAEGFAGRPRDGKIARPSFFWGRDLMGDRETEEAVERPSRNARSRRATARIELARRRPST